METHQRKFGFDHARTDLRDLDAVAQQVGTHGLRNGVYGVFRRAIYGAVFVRLGSGDRSDVDYVSPACGDHFGCDDAGDVEQSLDVRVDHVVPVGRGALVDVFESGGQPGVVEQQIDPIERFEVFSAFGFAAYVETERAATAALRFDGRFERCQPFGAAPCGDDVVSEGCEP